MAGAIFLDSDNNADFSDDKNIIYGHNMKDGSMFRGLRNFLGDKIFKRTPYPLSCIFGCRGMDIVIEMRVYTGEMEIAFLLGTQEEVPTLLLSTCGTDASKRLVIWCEARKRKVADRIF